jgi:hypothetical protein
MPLEPDGAQFLLEALLADQGRLYAAVVEQGIVSSAGCCDPCRPALSPSGGRPGHLVGLAAAQALLGGIAAVSADRRLLQLAEAADLAAIMGGQRDDQRRS